MSTSISENLSKLVFVDIAAVNAELYTRRAKDHAAVVTTVLGTFFQFMIGSCLVKIKIQYVEGLGLVMWSLKGEGLRRKGEGEEEREGVMVGAGSSGGAADGADGGRARVVTVVVVGGGGGGRQRWGRKAGEGGRVKKDG